ncbi:hypothetical protein [Pedobacter ginsengisoli]|uniref:hypothetical protein n=1 Tax=Pedobacter ginsengisoli TaxID=363852 RepID=UPI002551689A|nr:hypothetical protein [Pedobacter ginsengisoli]
MSRANANTAKELDTDRWTTVRINDQAYIAPAKWNEVSAEQLAVWQRICERNISGEQALMIAAIHFYKISKKLFFSLNSAQKIQLIDTLTFLGEGNKLTKWLIPEITSRFKKHIGPTSGLGTSTIKEFRASELYYNAYQATKGEAAEAALDMLIATLYRPKGKVHPDNDPREVLTELGVQKRAPVMARLNETTRKMILFNYEGCRAHVVGKYPTIFISGSGTGSNSLNDMEGVIKVVAGGKFGSFNETATTPLYLFLDHLSDEIKALENLKNSRK